MAKASDNVFPKLLFAEGAAPATPSSGQVKLYAKTDGKVYSKDDAGVEYDLTAAGGGGGTTSKTTLRKSANQSISSSTWTAVSWNTEDDDDLGLHDNSTNNSRITIPSGQGGLYLLIASLVVTADVKAYVQFRKNGTEVKGRQLGSGGASPSDIQHTKVIDLAVGDYVEVFIYGISGAPNLAGNGTYSDDECVWDVVKLG